MTDSAAALDTLYEELKGDNNALCILESSVAGTKLGRFQNKQVYMRNWSVGVVKINPGVTPKIPDKSVYLSNECATSHQCHNNTVIDIKIIVLYT